MARSNKDVSKRVAADIKKRTDKAIARALEKMRKIMIAELKKTVGVTAKGARRRGKGGQWRAVTPATVGAPPRKITGEGQRLVYAEVSKSGKSLKLGSSAENKGFFYMSYHDSRSKGFGPGAGKHPWIGPTVKRMIPVNAAVLAQEMKAAFKSA